MNAHSFRLSSSWLSLPSPWRWRRPKRLKERRRPLTPETREVLPALPIRRTRMADTHMPRTHTATHHTRTALTATCRTRTPPTPTVTTAIPITTITSTNLKRRGARWTQDGNGRKKIFSGNFTTSRQPHDNLAEEVSNYKSNRSPKLLVIANTKFAFEFIESRFSFPTLIITIKLRYIWKRWVSSQLPPPLPLFSPGTESKRNFLKFSFPRWYLIIARTQLAIKLASYCIIIRESSIASEKSGKNGAGKGAGEGGE